MDRVIENQTQKNMENGHITFQWVQGVGFSVLHSKFRILDLGLWISEFRVQDLTIS